MVDASGQWLIVMKYLPWKDLFFRSDNYQVHRKIGVFIHSKHSVGSYGVLGILVNRRIQG